MVQGSTRREMLTYVAPAILTFMAIPAFASAGSGNDGERGKSRHFHTRIDAPPPLSSPSDFPLPEREQEHGERSPDRASDHEGSE